STTPAYAGSGQQRLHRAGAMAVSLASGIATRRAETRGRGSVERSGIEPGRASARGAIQVHCHLHHRCQMRICAASRKQIKSVHAEFEAFTELCLMSLDLIWSRK